MSEQLQNEAESQIDPKILKQLFELAWNLTRAKQAEEAKRVQRIAVEEAIASLIPGPESGQKTVRVHDNLSITIKRGLNYKADCEAILKLDIKNAPIKTKTTRYLDEKGYEYYRENDEEAFKMLAEFVQVTPKKVAVEVKTK